MVVTTYLGPAPRAGALDLLAEMGDGAEITAWAWGADVVWSVIVS
jgi:hypothetical protein